MLRKTIHSPKVIATSGWFENNDPRTTFTFGIGVGRVLDLTVNEALTTASLVWRNAGDSTGPRDLPLRSIAPAKLLKLAAPVEAPAHE